MNKILQYLIKLRADGSSAIASANRISSRLEGIKKNADAVGNSLRKAFSPSSFANSLMNIPGMQFLTNPYTLLAGGIGAVVKLGSEAEMTAKAFKTLVGSEEKAKNMLQEIKAFADKTPFDQLHLTDVAQQMMTNLVPAEKTMTYLRQLGDISSGSKEKLSSLALVMGQVVGAGKLMGQDLMQFINAGFNPLKELEKMYPKKIYKELQDDMSKGQISAEMVASAIKHATSEGGQFHNMLEELSVTSSGQWSTLIGKYLVL